MVYSLRSLLAALGVHSSNPTPGNSLFSFWNKAAAFFLNHEYGGEKYFKETFQSLL